MKKRTLIFYIILLGLVFIFNFHEKKESFQYNEELKNTLKVNANNPTKIEQVLENYDSYPEELLEMLSRNMDMIDYVIDYPNKVGNVYSDTIGELKEGEIPLLLQYDSRWGYGYYGPKVLAINGCAPTSLAMVVAGLTNDNTITPYVIATYAYEEGYYVFGSGSSWSLMTEGSTYFGVEGEEIPLSKNLVYKHLKEGHPIICSMRPGDFTQTGHFIVLVGIENNKIKVHDPNSLERSSNLWDYEKLEPQIKNLWAFKKA